MNKIFKIVLMVCAIVAIIAIAGSVIYYFVFFKPEIEKAEIKLQVQKLELEKNEIDKKNTEETLRKENLENCLEKVEDWKAEILEEISGMEGITNEDMASMWEIYQDRLTECHRKYGKR